MDMEAYKERVLAERADLRSKIDRLEAFRAEQIYRDLPAAERDRLTAQLLFMRGYAEVLRQRIDAFAEN